MATLNAPLRTEPADAALPVNARLVRTSRVRTASGSEVALTSLPNTPLKPELFELATAAVHDGLARLRGLIASTPHLHISGPYRWYEVSVRENGLPSFSEGNSSAPLAYSSLFGGSAGREIDRTTINSFRLFVDALVADCDYQAMSRYRFRQDIEISNEKMVQLILPFAEATPAQLVEQYQTVYQNAEFDLVRFLPLYLRWEEEYFADQVPIDVVVPLLMIQAEFDEFRFGTHVVIRRMDTRFQRERATLLHSEHHVHEWAAQAATHAVVIEGRSLSRAKRFSLTGYPWEVEDSEAVPITLVERVLASIRIATGFNTGYAQVLIHYRYVNSEHSDSFQPDIHGIPVRRYPVSFDHWGWLRPTPIITVSQAEDAAHLFGPLEQVPESSTLAIAARRINDCYLRDRKDDAILDAVIAFETLLSDDEHQELTHKLALRVAAILKREPNPPKSPVEAFSEIKRIYAYRSKLVHGKSKEVGKYLAKYFGGDANRPLAAALDYLRFVMRFLLQNEKYRNPAEIDRHLLIGGDEIEASPDEE